VWLATPQGDAQACAEAARAFLELGDAESAGNMLDQGIARFPKDANLVEWKSRSLEKLGFRRAAAEYLERALALEPNRASALLGLGRIRVELGLETAAVEPLRQFVAQTGGDAASHALLARALRGARDLSGSYQAWKRSFELGEPRVEDFLSAASLALDADVRAAHPEATATSRGWLELALSRDPMCTRAHFQLGLLSHELGAYAQAVEHYRRAVETDPGCLMAITNLAILYSGAGDEAGTRQMVARALDLERDEDRRRALRRLLDPFESKPEDSDAEEP
jgi:tetratricopeptide (TPR) repeat protein